jgi:hypothetical protein
MHTKTQRLHILCSRLLFHLQEPKCCCARIGNIHPLCDRREFDRERQCVTIGELVSNNRWILQWQVLLALVNRGLKVSTIDNQFTHIAQPSAPLRSSPCGRSKKNLLVCKHVFQNKLDHKSSWLLTSTLCNLVSFILLQSDHSEPLGCCGQHPLETHYYDSVVDEPQLTLHCISPW